MDECKQLLERMALALEAMQKDIKEIKKTLAGGN